MPWSRTSGAMTSAMAPVAAEIMAGGPPRNAMDTAIVKEANRPIRGSTPAMIEKEMASGISASATTRPPRTSMRRRRGERSATRTDVTSASWGNTGASSGAEAGDAWLKKGSWNTGGRCSRRTTFDRGPAWTAPRLMVRLRRGAWLAAQLGRERLRPRDVVAQLGDLLLHQVQVLLPV